jgi:hypothetical protein
MRVLHFVFFCLTYQMFKYINCNKLCAVLYVMKFCPGSEYWGRKWGGGDVAAGGKNIVRCLSSKWNYQVCGTRWIGEVIDEIQTKCSLKKGKVPHGVLGRGGKNGSWKVIGWKLAHSNDQWRAVREYFDQLTSLERLQKRCAARLVRANKRILPLNESVTDAVTKNRKCV